MVQEIRSSAVIECMGGCMCKNCDNEKYGNYGVVA